MLSPLSATMSSDDWDVEGKEQSQKSNTTHTVSVRQVVTRTVTYSRAPLVEPVPQNKKRKVE